MPAEFRRHPVAAGEVARWVDPGEQMPADWDLGGEVWWRNITAHQRWSAARREWRTLHDPTYAWHWSRLPVGDADGAA